MIELVVYDWDEHTGLAAFVYENTDTGETTERTAYQLNYWTKHDEENQ